MKYVGSKNRISKELAPIIQSYITEDTEAYIEPFVGGANMIDKIKCKTRIGIDIHEYLISLLKKLSLGCWVPPIEVSEELYNEVKNNKHKYSKYLVGYIGFQMSYGGKWFGGYRRDKTGKRDYALEAYKNTMKQAPNLKDIVFLCGDFRDIELDNFNNCVFYCDIPYKGTTRYSTKEFPYDDFYEWCSRATINNTVLVSEYSMPPEFECIWEKETKVLLDSGKENNDSKNNRIEKLFIYKGESK